MSSSSTTGSSGWRVSWMYSLRLRVPRDLFASRKAVRNDHDSSPIAMNRTA